MKDSSQIELLKNEVISAVQAAYTAGYEQAKEDDDRDAIFNVRQAYQKGLNDAWEVAGRLVNGADLGIIKEFDGIDSHNRNQILEKYSASEAVSKLKEYEENQKRLEKSCYDCKFHYGEFCDVRSIKGCNNGEYWELAEDKE